MAKCPKYGTEVAKPVKYWALKGGRARKTVIMGMFHCPTCGRKFRAKYRETLVDKIKGLLIK